jgi:hypothetical protein
MAWQLSIGQGTNNPFVSVPVGLDVPKWIPDYTIMP